MKCWKCHWENSELTQGKVGFKSVCEKCDCYLHSCANCKFYQPGLPNSCRIPGTEMVRDREHFNFCEEFQPQDTEDLPTKNKADVALDLFGIAEDADHQLRDPKDKFRSLFE